MVVVVNGQTIINAERFNQGVDSTHFGILLNYSGNRGNVAVDRVEVQPTAVFIGKKHDVKLLASYASLFQGVDKVLNSGFVHARHSYKLNPKFQTFVFSQAQYNEVLLLRQRIAAGGGFRFNVVRKDSLGLSAAVGVMYENELLDRAQLLATENWETNYIRSSTLLSFKWMLSDRVQLDNVVYFQPRLGEFSDYRILNDLSIKFQINSYFQFLLIGSYRYDSLPPLVLKKYDMNANVGLQVAFQ